MIEGEEGEIEKERLMEGVRLKLMKLIKLIEETFLVGVKMHFFRFLHMSIVYY